MEDQIKQLHQKQTTGKYKDRWFDLTWTHSNIVKEIALRIGRRLQEDYKIDVDLESLETGALVHDIGVYSCFDEDLNPVEGLPGYLSHGHLGYEILLKEGYGEKVARFALTHTGTGFTIEDIERESLPFEKKDCIPVTLEEEILCYADKFHTKYPSFNTFEQQKERLEKFDPSKGVLMERFKKKFGIPELEDLMDEYDSWQKEFDDFFNNLPKE